MLQLSKTLMFQCIILLEPTVMECPLKRIVSKCYWRAAVVENIEP